MKSSKKNKIWLFGIILACPGNHDQRSPMRAAFADAQWMPSNGPIHWMRDFGPFAVVGLDTLLEGAHHGELGSDGLAFLASSLASHLVPKRIIFCSIFELQNVLARDLLPGSHFGSEKSPKLPPKRPGNAWSELWKTASEAFWRHQAGLFERLILISYGAHSESIFNLFSLFYHHFGGIFPLLRSPQNS